MRSHLLVITSQAEADAIANYIDTTTVGFWGEKIHVGGDDARQEGVYEWDTGEPLVYHHSLGWPPTSTNAESDCLIVLHPITWVTALCSETFYSICEK